MIHPYRSSRPIDKRLLPPSTWLFHLNRLSWKHEAWIAFAIMFLFLLAEQVLSR